MSLVATNAGPSGKKEGWAGDSNSLLRYHMYNLNVLFVLKDTFISCGFRAEIAEKQTQNLILWLAAMSVELPVSQGDYCWLRSLTGKEWDTLSWNVEVCEDSNKPGDIEPLNSDEYYVTVQAANHLYKKWPSHLNRKSLSTSVWKD